jgi:glucosamine--fructose-6-phosphate aminotransferase (isomerizing)
MSTTTPQRQYPHHMLREIHEQPASLTAALDHYVHGSTLDEASFGPVYQWFRDHHQIVFSASGSSRHASLAGEIMIEDVSGMPVDVEYASEYVYREINTLTNPGIIVVSQSGETADTLAALREANRRRHGTIAVTNVENSTMAREAEISLPTWAGRELAVPATKSFTAQLLVLNLIALSSGVALQTLSDETLAAHFKELASLPALIAGQLDRWERQMEQVAKALIDVETYLFLGRGIHYAIAREGALKLKESAYLQAEGYPSGELKHGPNALVGSTAAIVAIATVDRSEPGSVIRYEKSVQLLQDMKKQGATVVALGNVGDEEVASAATLFVPVAPTREHLLPIAEVVPLQLLAYFSAIQRGIDVDSPRNLTKAVLAE